MKKSLYILFVIVGLNAKAQNPTPATKQSQRILILNGTAHLGNGKVIQNSAIGFENGKLTLVSDATLIRIDRTKFDKIIDAAGKQIYPGLIEMNSSIGLTEIDLVRSTLDNNEVGEFNPNVRSIIAYNTDSKIIPTVRSNGVLLAQVVPEGGVISGLSSVVQLDGWNWEDAVYKMDEGVHVNWPRMFVYKGPGADSVDVQQNKIQKQLSQLQLFFQEAKSYCSLTPENNGKISADKATTDKNIKFEAMRKLFDGTKTMYVHCGYVTEIISAVEMGEKFGIRTCIVGGYDSYRVLDLLKSKNISVVLGRTHSLPPREDDDVDLPYKLPAILAKAGINYAISVDGSWQSRNLAFNAGTSAGYGLTQEEALMSITSNPAKILGIDKIAGTIEEGKDATLIISDGDILDMRTNHVVEAFIVGKEINLDNIQKQLYRKYQNKYGLNK